MLQANAQIPIFKQHYKPLKEFGGDGQQYLIYNFIDIKDNFIGKELSTILDIIELKVKEDVPLSGSTTLINEGIYLYLDNVGTSPKKSGKAENELVFIINIKNGVSADTAYKLARKNKRQWTCEEKKFYSNKVIANIQLLGLPSKEGPPPTEYKPTIIH